MSRNNLIAAAICVGVILVVGGAGGYWFYRTHERVQIDVDTGYTGLARYNEYRAAELFLDDIGVPAESRFALGAMPPTDRVLIVLAADVQARRGMEARLREWVASGGHLVIAASPPLEPLGADEHEQAAEPNVHEQDPLLTMAGLELARTQGAAPGVEAPDEATDAGPDASGDAGPPGTATPDGGPPDASPPDGGAAGDAPRSLTELVEALAGRRADRRIVGVSLPPGAAPMQAEMDWRWTLVDTVTEQQAQAYSTEPVPRPFVPVIEVPLERGWVTAVVDNHFMTNEAVGHYDHARLLQELVLIGATPPTGAVLVVRAQSNSLAGLIWRHAWAAVISVVVLIFVWVWMASRRFGPVLPRPDLDRRSMMEHVEAVGEFLWRHGHHELLLTSTRAALRHKLAARLGGQLELEGEALAQAVAEETGERESKIHQAFYGAGPRDRRAFTEAMRELQRLWRSK
jgi:hypothetical protein